MAAATSVHVVAIIEPIIQHADWFFPEGKTSTCCICNNTVSLERKDRTSAEIRGEIQLFTPLTEINNGWHVFNNSFCTKMSCYPVVCIVTRLKYAYTAA